MTDLEKWSKKLLRSIDDEFKRFLGKQEIFNRFFYEVLDDKQKALLQDRIEAFDKEANKSDEEKAKDIEAKMKKIFKEVIKKAQHKATGE